MESQGSDSIKRRQQGALHAAHGSPKGDRGWIWIQNVLTLAALFAGPLFSGNWNSRLRIAAGAALFVAGAVIGILGVRALGGNRTPHPAPLPGGGFVQSGIYAHVRHPLYLSLILVTSGWSVCWGSPAGLAISLCLAGLLVQKARLEERYLLKRFSEYRTYAKRVRGFVPRVYRPRGK